MVLTSALFLMSFAIHDAHAASRSAWRQHGGDEVPNFSGWGYNVVLLQNWANYPNLVNNGATGHGPLYLFEQYSAGIPAETDPGWTTTNTTIATAADPDALYWYRTSGIPNGTWYYDRTLARAIPYCDNFGDFTYADTTVYIPEDAALSSAYVNYGYVDDGAVITVYNSSWPDGVQIDSTHRQYGRLGAGDASYFDHWAGPAVE